MQISVDEFCAPFYFIHHASPDKNKKRVVVQRKYGCQKFHICNNNAKLTWLHSFIPNCTPRDYKNNARVIYVLSDGIIIDLTYEHRSYRFQCITLFIGFP